MEIKRRKKKGKEKERASSKKSGVKEKRGMISKDKRTYLRI